MSSIDLEELNSIPRELCVFLMNQVGICVSTTEAATTQELVNKVYQAWFANKNSSSSSSSSLQKKYANKEEILRFFTIWISSPMIEIQLKPLHRPFKVLFHWKDLVTKYGHQCLSDSTFEPIVSFQRNLFVQKWDEMMIEDPRILQLLYEEAKFNVLDGRYPVETFEQLAAIQLAIELGPFNQKAHSHEFLRSKLRRLIGSDHRPVRPYSLHPVGIHDVEDKAIYYYRCMNVPKSRAGLYRSYLEMCWPLPYYGSAYFLGKIERTSKNCLIYNSTMKVYVAVNYTGIHIIEEKRSKLLISLEYRGFRWQSSPFEEKVEELDENSERMSSSLPPPKTPSFFLYFWSTQHLKTNIIQVTSPQSRLIITLLDTFSKELSK
ncbi:FERM domain-containing protein 8 Bili [Brevipalpus obovatus]|uniref:FERM domain-containing protein 8 Bili n=1 Tax=Brevipalpus obovatus TaxID=246614 RepID=UPI003D9E9344